MIFPRCPIFLFSDSIRPYDDQHSGTELNAFFLCHRICADDDDPFLDLIAVEVFRISHGDNADFAVDCDVRIVIDNTSVDCFSDVFNRCVRQNVGAMSVYRQFGGNLYD